MTSGVRSVGVRPVPPVVSTDARACSDGGADRLGDRLAVGYDHRAVTSNPRPVSTSTISGPVVSS